MSHFTVLVIGEDPESQLAPFEEHPSPEEHPEWLIFKDHEDENRQKYETESTEYVVMPSGERLLPWNEVFRDKKDPLGSKRIPDDLHRIQVPFKETYPTFEAFMKDWYSEERDEKTGRYGYWHNPNAKWDWYQLGGRWTGFFVSKSRKGVLGKHSQFDEAPTPGTCDQIRKGDLDLHELRILKRIKSQEAWDKHVSKTEDPAWGRMIINAQDDDTRETYAERAARKCLITFAVLNEGKWYERGRMGWWANVSEGKPDEEWYREFNALIESLPDDALLSLYDCHI